VVLAAVLVVGLLTTVDDGRGLVHRVGPTGAAAPAADLRHGRPDVVLVLTDDQRPDTVLNMPTVSRRVRDRGTRFTRVIASTPTCCPSRASIVTGRYARETGVFGNRAPNGGWRTFLANGNEQHTLATALHARGYRTGLVGKYFNGYAQNASGAAAGHRPPGWDLFLTFASETGAYLDYALTDGSVFGSHVGDYSTDVLGARAARFVRRTPADQPLFLMFTPYAPHKPYRPPRRFRHTVELPSYRPDSVTHDVSDKPPFLRDRPRVPQHAIDSIRTRQQEMLLAVDEAVARLLRSLRRSGRLANTLFVYMSDNGLLIGDHHTIGKDMPYRFATDVPLLIRWDERMPAGAVDKRLVSTVDVTETILRATGTTMPTSGVDLMAAPSRDHVVLEGRRWRRLDGSVPHPAFCGVRTEQWLFVRWGDGFEELYDHEFDPDETVNRAADPAQQPLLDSMRATARASCVPQPPGFTWDAESADRGGAPSVGGDPARLREQRGSRGLQRGQNLGRRETGP
jgi:arylsulfatase A-like enzyme